MTALATTPVVSLRSSSASLGSGTGIIQPVADMGFHFPLAQNFWPTGQKIPPPPAGPPLSTGPKPFPPVRAPLPPPKSATASSVFTHYESSEALTSLHTSSPIEGFLGGEEGLLTLRSGEADEGPGAPLEDPCLAVELEGLPVVQPNLRAH